MAGILAIVGLIISLVGWIAIIVHAWKESSPVWGILCLVVSPICLVYVILNFSETWKYFLISIVGSALYSAGNAMAISGSM